MIPEQDVIRRVLNGETELFRSIVERYEKAVIRMIRNIVCSAESCEDVAQEVFLTAYLKLRSFDSERSSFSTWLFTIARNKSINALKKKRPFLFGEPPDKVIEQGWHSNDSREELYTFLDKELAALPAKQQRAFVMAEFEGLSYEEIAQIEATRIGTVKSRINRARNRLALALKTFMAGDT